MAEANEAVNLQNKHYTDQLRDTSIAFIVLTSAALGLRLVARFANKRDGKKSSLGWDDLLSIPAWLSCLATCISGIFVANKSYLAVGAGFTDAQRALGYIQAFRSLFVFQLVYVLAFSLSKISMVLLLLRIFVGPRIRLISWMLIGLLTAICIADFFAYIFLCVPPNRFWYRNKPGGHCNDYQAFYRSVNGPNIVTDLFIMVLPLPTIVKLHARVAKRVGIAITFLTGSIGLAASVVRWYYFLRFSIHSQSYHTQSELQIWTVVEACTYFIASCLPPLRVLVAKFGVQMSNLSTLFRSGRQPIDSDHELSTLPQNQQSGDSFSVADIISGNDPAGRVSQPDIKPPLPNSSISRSTGHEDFTKPESA